MHCSVISHGTINISVEFDASSSRRDQPRGLPSRPPGCSAAPIPSLRGGQGCGTATPGPRCRWPGRTAVPGCCLPLPVFASERPPALSQREILWEFSLRKARGSGSDLLLNKNKAPAAPGCRRGPLLPPAPSPPCHGVTALLMNSMCLLRPPTPTQTDPPPSHTGSSCGC